MPITVVILIFLAAALAWLVLCVGFAIITGCGAQAIGAYLQAYLEAAAPSRVDAELHIEALNVSPAHARAEITGISLSNPLRGVWTSDHMLLADRIVVDLQLLPALASGMRRIVVESLCVEGVSVTYERRSAGGGGGSNLHELLEAWEATRSQSERPRDRGETWSDSRALLMCGETDFSTYLGRAEVVDPSQCSSVREAVAALSSGRGVPCKDGGLSACEDGLCVVFSGSHRAYYLVYRSDKREAALWSAARTRRLCSKRDADALQRIRESAKLLDEDLVSSVSDAVEALCHNRIRCPEGCCVVYSSSHDAYFLVYQHGKASESWPWAEEVLAAPTVAFDLEQTAVPPLEQGRAGDVEAQPLVGGTRCGSGLCAWFCGRVACCTRAICQVFDVLCCCCCRRCFGSCSIGSSCLRGLLCCCWCHLCCRFGESYTFQQVEITGIQVKIQTALGISVTVTPKDVRYRNFSEEVGASVFDDVLFELLWSFVKTIAANVTSCSLADRIFEGNRGGERRLHDAGQEITQ